MSSFEVIAESRHANLDTDFRSKDEFLDNKICAGFRWIFNTAVFECHT